MTIGAAISGNTLIPVYTGNYVSIKMNDVTIGLVQTLSIARAANRRPIPQVGTSEWADIPPTTTGATINVTNMLAIPQSQVRKFSDIGILPKGSMRDILTKELFNITIVDSSGRTVATCKNCGYNQDTLDITANEPLTLSFSLLCQDADIAA